MKVHHKIITLLFSLHLIILIIGSRMKMSFIETDHGVYVFVFSLLLSMVFLRILTYQNEKFQNIVVLILAITLIISFKIQVLFILALLGIKVIGRYEQTVLNKVMKITAVGFMVLAVFSFLFIPTVFLSYTEAGTDVYRILESDNGEHIVIIKNYGVSSYGTMGQVEVSFNKKRFGYLLDEIEEHYLDYELRMTYEWLDNDRIRIYDFIFEFEDNKITVTD